MTWTYPRWPMADLLGFAGDVVWAGLTDIVVGIAVLALVGLWVWIVRQWWMAA